MKQNWGSHRVTSTSKKEASNMSGMDGLSNLVEFSKASNYFVPRRTLMNDHSLEER